MDRLIILLVIIIICIIGFISKIKYLYKLCNRQDFVLEYHNKFWEFVTQKMNGIYDDQPYNWLMFNIDRMQNELGKIGYISYIDNLKGIQARQVPALLSIFPEIEQFDTTVNNYNLRKRFLDVTQVCINLFLRIEGSLARWKETTKKELINPFSLFGEGIRRIIHFPINCLYWIGVFPYNVSNKIKSNFLFRFAETIFKLISLLGTIIPIVIGWEQFVDALKKLFF